MQYYMYIKFVVFDFDGVFTDGKFLFNHTEHSLKSYNAKDAFSLKLLKNNNIKCGVITNDKIISIEHAQHIYDRLDKVSIGEDRPKLEILNNWLKEYNFSYNEVAYIGDDLPDLETLKSVGFSACPNDAVEDVKNIVNFISTKNGGEGAVREFVDLIIKNNKTKDSLISDKHNVNNDGKITAVIPVRSGSTRCKNKNIREFGNTNLLKLKIETLKKVKGIDKILVSSNCDEMLEIAKQLGVNIYKREPEYCTTMCSGSDMYCSLANSIDTQYMLYTHCVAPFINVEIYEDIINIFRNNNNKYDSIMTAHELKEYLWYNNKPLNYIYDNAPPSQTINGYYIPTFGACLVSKDFVLKNRNIIGFKPYFYTLDYCKSIDIDYAIDFYIAENMYLNNIIEDKICDIILKKKNNKLKLLDCTIRDGGYLNNWNYTDDEILDCYKAVTKAGFDYFEIGFKTNKELLPGKGKWCYSYEDDINKIVNQYQGCKIVVMAKIGTVTIDDFVEKNKSNITMVRVLLARNTIENGKNISKYNEKDLYRAKYFCQQLIDYGYEVCMNFGCGDLIDEEEVKNIASVFQDIKIKALYLADTYGGFNSHNTPIQLHNFYKEFEKYDSNIEFGFHIHNNNGNGLEKSEIAINHGCSMIDASIYGLGRGSGNLKTEEYICNKYGTDKNFRNKITPILEYYDKHIQSKKEYNDQKIKLHHPLYNIAGVLSLHPDYILELLENIEQTIIQDIDMIFKLDKYTLENKSRNYNKNLIKQLK